MSALIISPKFQIVIPKQIREAMQLKAGMKVQAIHYGSRIELVPVIPLEKAFGMFKGSGLTPFEREEDPEDRA